MGAVRPAPTSAVSLEDRRQGIAEHLDRAYAAMWLLGEVQSMALEPPHGLAEEILREHLRDIAENAMSDAVSSAHSAFTCYWQEVQ